MNAHTNLVSPLTHHIVMFGLDHMDSDFDTLDIHLVRFTRSPSMYGSGNNEPEGKSNPVVFSPFKSN